MATAITARGLTKEFQATVGRPRLLGRRERRTVRALDDLTLDVQRGERVAYIGPNGAGKSTSIRMFTGILHPTSGSAEVLGLVPWAQRRRLATRIGTIFGQRSQLVNDLPARATFDLHARIYRLPRDEYVTRRDVLLDLFEARDLLDQTVRSMSLGQRMRCELIASLLHSPEIVFLDEPTSGLDLIAKRTLRSLIVRLNEHEDVTVLLTSHDVADLETVARRVVIIDHGRIVFDGVFLAGGMLLPLELWPHPLDDVLPYTPFAATAYIPAHIATGHASPERVVALVALQAAWLLVLAMAVRAAWARGERPLAEAGA